MARKGNINAVRNHKVTGPRAAAPLSQRKPVTDQRNQAAPPSQREPVTDQRNQIVTKQLQDIATLVGEHQNPEVTLNSGRKVVPGLGLTDEASQLSTHAVQRKNGGFLVACVGPPSSGKTTLVESLQGAAMDPRATGLKPTTGVVTHIVYGNDLDEATLYETENTQGRNMPLEEFWKNYTLQGEKELKNVEFALLQYDTPIYRKGFRLVDTPGITRWGETDIPDLFNEADILLLTLDGRLLLNLNRKIVESIFNFSKAKKETTDFVKKLFWVINDFSLIDPEKKELEDELPQMFKSIFTTGDEFDQALFESRVFIVNAKSARDAKLAGAVGDTLEQTGLPALGQELQLCNKYSLEATVELTPSIIGKARRSIAEQKRLHDKSVEELETTLDNIEQQLDEISQEFSPIETSYKELVKKLGTNIQKQLSERIPEDMTTSLKIVKAGCKNISARPWKRDNNIAMIEGLVDSAAESFRKLVTGYVNVIPENLEAESGDFADKLKKLGGKINNVTSQLHEGVKKKRKEAVVTEQQRLDTIDNLLTEQFVEIIRTVYGLDPTPIEMVKLIVDLPSVGETS